MDPVATTTYQPQSNLPPGGSGGATPRSQLFQDNQVSFVGHDGATSTGDVPLLDIPTMSPDDAIALLMSLSAKLGNESTQSAIEGVQANAEQQKAAREEQQKKLIEAAAEIAKADKAGVLKQVFGWIGVALAVVAAVAVAVATFGAATPASGLAIAGVVAPMTGAVLAGTTQIVSSIPGAMESMGDEGSKAFLFTMMALQIAAAIFSVGAGAASAAGAGTSTASNASKGATAAAEVAAKAAKLEVAAEKVGKAAQIAGGANEVAAGGNEIAIAHFEAEAEYDRADAAEVAKWLKQLAAQDETAIEFVRALQEIEDKGWQIVTSIAKEANDLQHTVLQQSQA